MIPKEDLLLNLDKRTLWKKYCGFLDLSVEEFMAIQDQLLLEQIDLVNSSPLTKKITGERKPSSIEEFRQIVPITTYKDYLPHLEEKREDILSEKPFCWAHTSGIEGDFKWVPYTSRAYHRLIDSFVSALILASANKKGDVHIKKGSRIVFHLPTRPYLGGHIAFGLSQRIACQTIPPLEIFERISFAERTEKELDFAEKHGVDFIFSLPANTADMGAKFTGQLNSNGTSLFSLSSIIRDLKLAWTRIITRIKDKPVLPRHMHHTQGIISIGADSHFYSDEIDHYWGKRPYDIYLATETGCIALPGWEGNAMTFTPFSGFLEFIPEEEWFCKEKMESAHPKTVLINELEAGKRYQIVVTNFYGMPFLRYRPGDIIKIESPKNRDSSTGLPQMLFESRVSNVINIGSSQEISEKNIWQALLNSGLKYEDWFLTKEECGTEDNLHLYVEIKNGLGSEVDQLFFKSSLPVEIDAKSMPNMPDIPLKMTLLPQGTFQSYRKEKESAGFDPACFKAVHINPQDDLLRNKIPSNGAGQP